MFGATLVGARAGFNSVDACVAVINGLNMNDAPSSVPDIDGMMDLVTRFDAARADDPALSDAEMDEVIRLVPGKRAIVTGTWQGRAVVFRFILRSGGQAATREWQEMMRVWPYMQSGKLRIAQPLHHSPAHQVSVIERINGTPLMGHFWNSDPQDRSKWLRPAADWLRTYTLPTEETGPPRAGKWLARAAEMAATQPHPKLIRREKKVLGHLRRIAPMLDQPWRHAISHGDFHPNNLLLHQDCLTGIDCGGSQPSPIYKDMARFLMHMGRRALIPSEDARFGVDAQGITGFAEAFALSDHERDLVLPFMLGCEALLRVEHAGMKRGRIRRAVAMTDALIEDLAQI